MKRLILVCAILANTLLAPAATPSPRDEVKKLCDSWFSQFGFESVLRCRQAASTGVVRICVRAYRDLEGQLRCMQAADEEVVRTCIKAWEDWEGQLSCMLGKSAAIVKKCIRKYGDRESQLLCIRYSQAEDDV